MPASHEEEEYDRIAVTTGDVSSSRGLVTWSVFGRYHGDKVNADPDLVTEKHFSIDDSNIDVRGEVIGTRNDGVDETPEREKS